MAARGRQRRGHPAARGQAIDQGEPRGQAAAALSKRYYRRMRNEDHPRPPRDADTLKHDLTAYVKQWGAH